MASLFKLSMAAAIAAFTLSDDTQDFLGAIDLREAAYVLPEVFRSFVEASPVSVMFRGTLEHVFGAQRLDGVFERVASRQYCHELAFSTCAELLSLVVIKARRSMNAAFRAKEKEIAVSVQAVYQKLAGIEPVVSEALVRETGQDLAQIVRDMKAVLPGPLPGFDVRIVDGNQLAGTQHRLQELHSLGDAALPGQTVAVLNPHLELIEEVLICQDGHANQKPLFVQLVNRVLPGQCWIGDRDCSTRGFLFGVQHRRGYFLVRHHAVLPVQSLGARRRRGRCPTGVVFEQKVRVTGDGGQELVVRRITVVLDQPTRDGEREIHLLTTLPAKVRARQVAMAYVSRWNIETAFAKMTTVLRCELDTLGYPQAALFGFCLAIVMYNAVATVMAALRTAHPKLVPKARAATTEPKLSFYYLADEISGVSRGMQIAIPANRWATAFGRLTSKELAKKLLWLAKQTEIDSLLSNPYRKQKRRKRRPMTTKGGHISTYQLLEKRNA